MRPWGGAYPLVEAGPASLAVVGAPRMSYSVLGKAGTDKKGLEEQRMPFVSIRSRLIFLAAVLLAILAVASALLIGQLMGASDDLAEEAKLVSIVKNANSASKHFGDLKYWITDSAKTLFVRSQQNADAAKARLDLDLQAIAPVDPAGVAAIGGQVDTLSELARKAAEAYSSDDSAGGNALMQQAQIHVLNVDREIEQIVDRSEQHALTRRDASMRQAETAVNVSVAGGIITLVVALSLTALIVRSINAPLRRLEHSMTAITRGELNAPIPPPSRDEIGAMASTLGMLRDSLIERDRLERERRRAEAEIRAARDAAEAALTGLKAAQANLIQAEKMASLGQLTAGIAHEIKNPLNFVNNFAALSTELLDELKQTTGPALVALDSDERTEAEEVIATLTGNLQKIIEHGKRADNIVKSMLEHSRGVTGERREVDLNGLIDEAMNLAYHGARAQDQIFNITMERNFDPEIRPIELAPQEMTRVFLNLFGNAFYAATKRQRDGVGPDFRPVLTVTTHDLGEAVEVRVRDNGTGIRPEIRDKLFQPFFTTKPTGEGTGLGLSISYDIVTQQHGGTIKVVSEPGAFTEFTIRLPR
jgi:signal transduction histidine kinase